MPNNEMPKRSTLSRRLLIGGGGLTMILIITLIAILSKHPGQTTPGETTADLEQNAVAAMVGYGLMPTLADGSVQEDHLVSRSEFAHLLNKVLQVDQNVTNQQSYADVLPSHPDYLAIESVKYLFGYQKPDPASENNTAAQSQNQDLPEFNPDAPLKCSEAVAILSTALNLDPAAGVLADAIKLPADDPIRAAGDQYLLNKDAARLFYLLIISRLPGPAPTFAIDGIN